MFLVVETNVVKVPLWDQATIQDPTMTNQRFLREYVANFLQFPNLTAQQIRSFVNGLFDLCRDLPLFKQHLRSLFILFHSIYYVIPFHFMSFHLIIILFHFILLLCYSMSFHFISHFIYFNSFIQRFPCANKRV